MAPSDDPLAALTAPTDPRQAWDLPPFGELPTVATLGDRVTRVLAPNPSPMTLDGTNTYVLAEPGAGVAIIVDPGPRDAQHLTRVEEVLALRDAEVAYVVVTHHHVDHAEAAGAWAERFACPVVASTPEVAGTDGRIVADGAALTAGHLRLDVVATPGHTRDHVALRLEDGTVLTGDHVLGRGTSVVAHPDGDLTAYLTSLHRMLDLGPARLLPGHGPELTEDPAAVLEYYRDHRRFREEQILALLGAGAASAAELVARIYADVDRRLWPAAEASTRATLASLDERGRLRWRSDGRAEVPGNS